MTTTLDELPTIDEVLAVPSKPVVSFQLEQNFEDELEDVASISVLVDWPGDTILFMTDFTEDPEDNNDPTVYIRIGFTLSQELAEEHTAQAPAKSFEELVPEQYRLWIKVFDKKVSECLPEHGRYDHAIDVSNG
ncbi:unnamed protein product [Peniophora sp. CBMAI 1063]|nr:unnamed protein product [Peniophora sp. CBMAI 1063]